MSKNIEIKNASEHNLKSVDLQIPKNKLVVFTGVSGSGKSSMALDTIYAEGQRRYVESLSSYARQFLGVHSKPEVESIQGLSPAIAISQKKPFHNPRSTVGTITEVYDYLRLLFSRIGHPHCPECGREVQRQSAQEIVDAVLSDFGKSYPKAGYRLLILAPLVKDKKGEYTNLFENMQKKGFTRVRVDGQIRKVSEDFVLLKNNRHTIEAVVDRIIINKDNVDDDSLYSRLFDSITQALNLSGGELVVSEVKDSSFEFPEKPEEMEDHLYSELFACPDCNISLQELEPRSFSFNSPHGACPRCDGLGTIFKVDEESLYSSLLSVNEGGVYPFSSQLVHDTWYKRLVKAVAVEQNIDLDQEFRNMSDKDKEILTWGTGDKEYLVSGRNRHGKMTSFKRAFHGFTAEVQRVYNETNSDRRRSEMEKFMVRKECPKCSGSRLKKEARSVAILGKNIAQVTDMNIENTLIWSKALGKEVSVREREISAPIVREIFTRLRFLNSVGLSYLTLSRAAATLSGGEAQRIRLASQIGSGLSGVVYVLDEPSVGLHYRDMNKLMDTLKYLRDLDNTVVVVEHDQIAIEEADCIVDFGPGGGRLGGEVVATGSPEEIKEMDTLTGDYLAGRKRVVVEQSGRVGAAPGGRPSDVDDTPPPQDQSELQIINASHHNLKNIDVQIPFHKFTCVTGVSGSGKSTLVLETIHRALRRELGMRIDQAPGKHDGIIGAEAIDRVYEVDQSPIGQTPRSNPATYTKAFDYIRKAFARTKTARMKGFDKGHFSFNTKGGRCEACQGQGVEKIEMQFLPDVYVTCEVCDGARYNREALEVEYRGKTIKDVLDMTVDEALSFFSRIDPLQKRLQLLSDVGLGYIQLGQPAPTLSGGEAQRVKLAKELSKSPKGHTFYILDEPSIGLHPHDLVKLLRVLHRLVARGNTVLVIEHNLDIIRNADWLIDLGPEGGEAGGEIVFTGTPEEIVDCEKSYTGRALEQVGPY